MYSGAPADTVVAAPGSFALKNLCRESETHEGFAAAFASSKVGEGLVVGAHFHVLRRSEGRRLHEALALTRPVVAAPTLFALRTGLQS